MSYLFVNHVTNEQMQQLSAPVQDAAAIEAIAAIAEQTSVPKTDPNGPAKTDQIAVWIKLLESYGFIAQRGGGANAITVLPGGNSSPDRITMTVADGLVTITGVSEVAA
ncbi:hypothetical protein J5226_14490 [Lysobacter sp. K5869]|uniref:hypothetical protein n=1 Tax=Lysobacter sp. K5869 TaxID=2820808 RepID=UPI001C06455B|nr:hypothetical protein [Lysobacter sp. K5869]QWP74869.1 hypothetical protein J5226_14490 [Lysobacter sp. K5869]